MKLENNLRRKWVSFQKPKYKDIELTPLTKKYQEGNFIQYLPQQVKLSSTEMKRYNKLKMQTGYSSGSEYYEFMILRMKNGHEDDEYKEWIYVPLLKQIEESKKINIQLPSSYLLFFKTKDYINRFRIGCEYFFTNELILPFHLDKEYYQLPFFGDSHGWAWWSIIFDKNGNHFIVFNDYHWEELAIGGAPSPSEHSSTEYFICSDSFDEFIKRLSIDFRIKEGENKK